MLHSDIFIALLVTSISLAAVATVLSHFRVPTIVGFVATGILIGPSGFNWVHSLPAAKTISELGVIFLMFSLGLEISLVHLRKMIKPLITIGLTQVGITIFVTCAVFYYAFDFSFAKSFVFGACLSLSSTAVILKLLSDKRETETPHGRVSIIVLLFQDIAALPLMVMIPLLAAHGSTVQSGGSIGQAVAMILGFLVLCGLAGYFLIPKLFAAVARTQSREVFFFSIISMTFIIAFLAEKVGLSMSLGAFVAGVLISESPYNKQALAEFSPLRDIFLGFFFASVGMMVDLSFVISNIGSLLWLVPLLFFIKFSIIYCIVKFNSHSHGVSFASALALTQIGEFSFILGASALNFGLIQDLEFQYFLALAVASLLSTPLLFSVAIKGSGHGHWGDLSRDLKSAIRMPSSSAAGEVVKPEDEGALLPGEAQPRRALVVGLGHAGITVLKELKSQGIPCLGLDFNLSNVEQAHQNDLEAIFGDATRPEVLESAGVLDSFMVIVSVSGKNIGSQIVSQVKKLNPKIKLVVRVHYLLERESFPALDENSFVVSESESARAIINKVLLQYEI